MRELREIFAKEQAHDPGQVFYTIRQEDVGKSVIDTEIGPLVLGDVMGRVLKHDVGKRVYRLRVSSVSGIYIWQVENETQFAHRRQGTA